MPRIRVETGIKDWEGADLALLNIGRLDRDLEKYEAQLQAAIEEAKQIAVRLSKPLQERKNRLVMDLKSFCEAHAGEMKGKSRKLNYGTVSFRLSTRIVIKSIRACVAALKSLGLIECVMVKETPNKERLRELDDAILAQVYAQRVTEDAFGYEVDREKLQEAA
jgi:phage host-nuclease inhibitor protein Gam